MKHKSLFTNRNLSIKNKKYFSPKLWQFILEIKLGCRKIEQVRGLFSQCLLLLLIFSLTACQQYSADSLRQSNSKADAKEESVAGRLDTQLTLDDAVLEQSNNEGLVWKIQAKRTTYSDDRQIAYLEDITANLLQDREIILKLKGKQGEIREQGNLIVLQEEIVASDARNETILRGNVAQWRPLENVLTLKDNLQVNHPNLIVTADTAQYFTDTESLELTGRVVANTEQPALLLESDRLLWQIPQQKVIADNPLNVVRYQKEAITDRLVADKAQVDLERQTIALNSNVALNSVQPQLKIATNSATWNYQQRFIESDRPIQIVDRQQQLTITGNQGQIDFETEIATMTNGVKAINNLEPATLYSEQAVWKIPQKEITATGNVIYNKEQPKIDLTGDRAIIDLEADKAIVTSDRPQQKPVVSVVND